MFQGIVRRAENTIESIVAKYTGRVMVAVPFLVAAGFATAAATVKLIELYGEVAALGIVAGFFAALTLVTLAAVGTDVFRNHHHHHGAASEHEARNGHAHESEQIASEVEGLLTPELRAVLGAAAPVALPFVTRTVMRNLPIVVLLGLILLVFLRFSPQSEDGGEMTTADAMAAAPPPV